jgi:excisionase family DNA binding protein
MISPGSLQNRAVVTAELDRRISPEREEYASPSRAAEFWGVHKNKVYRDIRKGALPAVRLPGGQFRVRWIDIHRYGRPVE